MQIEITFKDGKVITIMEQLRSKFSDLSPIMREIGEELLSNWQMQWGEERDPYGQRWHELAPSTLRKRRQGPHKRRKSQILRDTGIMLNSFTVKDGRNEVVIGTNVFYANFHQFGTKKMPQRMLLPEGDLPAEDAQAITDIIRRYLTT